MTSHGGFPGTLTQVGAVAAIAAVLVVASSGSVRADTVTMKNGIVYRCQGAPDRDETLVYMWDGLKRIVVRDSKIDRITADNSFRTGETFKLDQPIIVHGGVMPKDVAGVEAGPWNEKGRRTFQYIGAGMRKSAPMEQAIIEMTPHKVRYRGIDGFWVGHLATTTIPREVVVGLLDRVERENQAERERAVRFEIEAGWYLEARAGLDALIRDFPGSELKQRAADARTFLIQAEAAQRRTEIDVRLRAHQHRKAEELRKSLTEKEIAPSLAAEVRELDRKAEEVRRDDRADAEAISRLADGLPTTAREFWKQPVLEVLQALKEAPDAVRGRLAPFRKAAAAGSASPAAKPEERLALALSGYVAGADAAGTSLSAAETLWKARGLVQDYLGSPDASLRRARLEDLNALSFPGPDGEPEVVRKLEALTRIVGCARPPLRGGGADSPDRTILHRVPDGGGDDGGGDEEADDADSTAEPTEYLVHLPPEYNPLYDYPAVVTLHDGRGPRSAVDWWAAEADRRGYIVIAPQYNLAGEAPDYRYTPSEHAAVELSLRDARRRYSIDSDRVFLGGRLVGGNMAWDYGLAHFDLFAGVVVVSGLPAKYVPRYLDHHEHLPLYYVTGDLAPAAVEVVFEKFIKPRIFKAWDVTYSEYHRRGLEDFPEEVEPIFDWMDKHRRETDLKSFSAVSARESDDRFHGVVIRGFAPGRTTAPEAVEMLGRNLRPASFKFSANAVTNSCRIDAVSGLRRLDVWLSPRLFDFKRKVSVRVNGGRPIKGRDQLEIATMLEDLRLRGDRRQIYWHRVSVE